MLRGLMPIIIAILLVGVGSAIEYEPENYQDYTDVRHGEECSILESQEGYVCVSGKVRCLCAQSFGQDRQWRCESCPGADVCEQSDPYATCVNGPFTCQESGLCPQSQTCESGTCNQDPIQQVTAVEGQQCEYELFVRCDSNNNQQLLECRPENYVNPNAPRTWQAADTCEASEVCAFNGLIAYCAPDFFPGGGSDDDNTPPSPQTGGSGTDSNTNTPPPPQPTLSPHDCGLHRGYAKICYDGNSQNPTQPAPLKDVIPRLVQAADNPEGYIVVSYNMDSDSKLSRRIGLIRMHLQAASSQGSDLPVLVSSNPNILTEAGVNRPSNERSIVIIPYRGEDITGGVAGLVYQEVQSILAQAQSIREAAAQRFLDDAYARVSEFGDDLQAELREYEEVTGRGIRVYFTSADLPEDLDELLEVALEVRASQRRGINQPDISRNDFMFYSQLGVCDVHILVNQEETKILHNEICPVLKPKAPTSDASPEEITVVYITGIMGLNQEKVDLRQVLARAAQYDRDRIDVAQAENRLQATRGFVSQRLEEDDTIPVDEKRALQADLQILTTVGNLELAQDPAQRRQLYNQLLQHAESAHPEFIRYATKVVVESARREHDCSEAGDVLEAFKRYLKVSEQNELNDQIALCQRQAIQDTCDTIDDQQPSTIGAATIVFIKDADMPEDTFERLVSVIDERVKRMPELRQYSDRISFWRADAATQIATSQGILEPPVTNHRVVLQSLQACPGDMALVLSEQNYLPWYLPQGGMPSGFISYDACGDSESCMALYTARGLARNLFGIQGNTDQTVTARLRLGDGESQIAMRFDEAQQEQINEYFAAGWLN